MIWRLMVLGLISGLLAGCQTTGTASVKGGECRVFERPEFAVRGKRAYDQDWIDGNIEAGVGACGWKRPKARPASLDIILSKKAEVAPAKKRGLVQRVKERVVAPFIAPAEPVAQSPPPAPSPTRDPVDELLQPTEIRRVY